MRKHFFLIALLLLTFVLFLVSSNALDPFIVRVIYFNAQGTEPVNHAKYDKIIKDMQDFFRTEMIRHNYGDKTFKIETDAAGDLVIHEVNGRHLGDHYTGGVFDVYYQKISKEIPFEINNTVNRKAQDDIYIVIIGGVEIVDDGNGSPWGGGWQFFEAVGGTGIVNENFEKLYPNHYLSIIGHEFGHALGWEHNKSQNALMGPLPFGDFGKLTNFETRLLNKHHLFNDIHILNAPPTITSELTSKAIGKEFVRFQVEAKGVANLYHCQVQKGQDYVGSDALEGKSDVIQIDVSRDTVQNGDALIFVIYDVNGNRIEKKFDNIQIPEPVFDDRNFKYLTIRHKHPDSLVPINNPLEWVGWENAGVFEKTPNGISQKLPPWYIHVPIFDKWKSWFYSTAKANIIYDISGGRYNQFGSYFYLPNPCQKGRTVELIAFADDIEIYHSGILRPPEAQNKQIVFAIPDGTKELVLQVTDAGDGIHCDHFALGEAKISFVENEPDPSDNEVGNGELEEVICPDCIPEQDNIPNVITVEEQLGINPKQKLTTIWATIKAR